MNTGCTDDELTINTPSADLYQELTYRTHKYNTDPTTTHRRDNDLGHTVKKPQEHPQFPVLPVNCNQKPSKPVERGQ